MLDPQQQKLPEPLEAALESALQAGAEEGAEETRWRLEHVVQLAEETGYL